jgi:hypothetical protein
MTQANKELDETEANHTTENLESVGQMIIGGLETVGGILTGDPITRAEGEFNVEVGSLHQESNKVLTAIDTHEKHSSENTNEIDQPESE